MGCKIHQLVDVVFWLQVAQSIRRKGFVDDEAHGRFPEPGTVEAPEKTCDSLMIKTYIFTYFLFIESINLSEL
jgi:hypothetical protein